MVLSRVLLKEEMPNVLGIVRAKRRHQKWRALLGGPLLSALLFAESAAVGTAHHNRRRLVV
jgi:hypothetical protein